MHVLTNYRQLLLYISYDRNNLSYRIAQFIDGGNIDRFKLFRYLIGKILIKCKVVNILTDCCYSLISEYLMKMAHFTVSAMVWGYHVYKEIGDAEVHEELRC